jgi:MFS family permease
MGVDDPVQHASHPPIRLGGYLGGVFLTQLVDSALHLAQPLLLAKLSGSLGGAAFFSAFDTGIHMLGTYIGGWPTEKFGARRVLVMTTFLRGVALAGIPTAMICGFLNLWWAMGCYTLEALIRGFVDTSVHTIPLELARHRSDQLDRINSRYELTFDLGGVAGPLILGGLMLWGGKVIPHILIPVGFVLSAAAYFFIPSGMGREARTESVNGSGTQQVHHSHGGSWAGLKYILTKQPLLITCVGLMSFNIYPLRKLLSAFFAKGLLHKSATVGQIGAAFALGGVVGAVIYALTKHRDSGAKWVALGAVGTFILALGWLPANLWIMTAVVFLFAVTNVCARLTLTRKRQELTPLEHAGGVTSASQFGVNAVSVVIKTMVGAAFSAGMGAYGAFALVGGVLALMGAGQFALATYLPKISSGHHKAS